MLIRNNNIDKLQQLYSLDGKCLKELKELEALREKMTKQEDNFKKTLRSFQRDIDEYEDKIEKLERKLQRCEDGQSRCKEEVEAIKQDLRDCKSEKNECEGKLSEKSTDQGGTDHGGTGHGGKEGRIEKGDKAQLITQDDLEPSKCGPHAGYFRGSPENQIGKYGFRTHDLLKKFFPEMHGNPKIHEAQEEGAYPRYGAVNYEFSFDKSINYAWETPSNMWCYKCKDRPYDIGCQKDSDKSFCVPAGYYASSVYNQNFFTQLCPNLICDDTEASTIKARLTKPLILVNRYGQMIDKNGENTGEYYGRLLWHLKSNGRMKDCAGDSNCERFKKIFEKVAWDTDKEVALEISRNGESDNKPRAYFDDSQDQDISVSTDTNIIF